MWERNVCRNQQSTGCISPPCIALTMQGGDSKGDSKLLSDHHVEKANRSASPIYGVTVGLNMSKHLCRKSYSEQFQGEEFMLRCEYKGC